MKIIHGKMRIRSPECNIKYLERLSETFIWHSQLGAPWPVLISIGVFLTTLGYLRKRNQFKKQLENTIDKDDMDHDKKNYNY